MCVFFIKVLLESKLIYYLESSTYTANVSLELLFVRKDAVVTFSFCSTYGKAEIYFLFHVVVSFEEKNTL